MKGAARLEKQVDVEIAATGPWRELLKRQQHYFNLGPNLVTQHARVHDVEVHIFPETATK